MKTKKISTRTLAFGLASAALASVLAAACSGSGPSSFNLGPDAGHAVDATHADVTLTHDATSDGMSRLGNPDTGGGPGMPDTGLPNGEHGCDVSCMAAGGTCAGNVCTIKENPGALTAAQEQALNAGGNGDPTLKWLYPYDKTVFPRGLIAPTLQFAGTAPDAILVHITYATMDYVGYYAAATGAQPAQAKLSDASWTAVTQGAAAGDTVTVAITKLSGGVASGPITETWSIAQGNMRGQIYYETYGSKIIGGAGVGIMSLAPGAAAPTPIAKGCGNVCHTASADGSTLVANAGNLFNYFKSTSYDLKASPPSTIYANPGTSFTYGALYPDGSFAMSSTNYRTWLPGKISHLVDTKTGASIAAPGWDGAYKQGGTAAFAPDGKLFAFNHNDDDQGEGHTLMLASFAVATKTFSGFETLTTDAAHTLGWPNFTPDDKSLVYHAAVGGAADGGGTNSGYETDNGATGDVYRIDLATKTPVRLDALDGYGAGGTTYLPENDPDLSFAPTVLPEAVGGYFWVVFTSHRSYGNTFPSQDNNDQNGKLWVAAIDLNPTAGMDSSHPAFYLDGQEGPSDNLRGFWVLSPCQQSGTKCGAGDECCTGFCRPDGEGGAYSCVAAPVTGCSNVYEKCTSTSQCCQASQGYTCIGGFCSAPPPK